MARAGLIQAMTGAPASKGLFRRIIVQSSPQFACRRKSASKIARFVIDRLAIPRNDFEALQKVDPVALTNLYPEVQLEEGELDRPYLPVISESMPVHPADVEHAGLGHDHDLLIGSSAEEASIFARLSGLEKSVFYRRADQKIRWLHQLGRASKSLPQSIANDRRNRSSNHGRLLVSGPRIADCGGSLD